MGGSFSTPDSTQLVYDRFAKDTYNNKGMVGTVDPELYERVMHILESNGVRKYNV